MALPLLWISILALTLFLKNKHFLSYTALLASAFLLCFARIEGFAFLAATIIIISRDKEAREFIKKKTLQRFLLPIGFFLIAFVFNTIIDINFYREIAKAVLPMVQPAQAKLLGDVADMTLPTFYTWKIFFLYGMLGFFLLGAFSIVKYLREKQFYKLLPFFITFPTFIYLFDSHITPDQPWMLRRYMFSLLPVAIFYSGLLLGEWLEKKPSEKCAKTFKISALAISIILLAGNLPAFIKFLPYSENRNLLQQIGTMSQQFSSSDLILVDQQATLDGWSMMTAPMSEIYGKNAVYFFNTQDLSKLDLKNFSNVYLIAPKSQASYYLNSSIGNRLNLDGSYILNFSKLNTDENSPLETVTFPQKKEMTIQGEIFKISK